MAGIGQSIIANVAQASPNRRVLRPAADWSGAATSVMLRPYRMREGHSNVAGSPTFPGRDAAARRLLDARRDRRADLGGGPRLRPGNGRAATQRRPGLAAAAF